jgi:biopolymer transport protein ExbD
MLVRYREASEATKNKAMITIQAENKTKHQRVIDVMNACGEAGITHVTVGMSE